MKILALFLLSLTVALGQTPSELDRTLRKLAPDLVASTVAILVGQGTGSGVIVSPNGLVITAAHVTSTAGTKMKVLLADGRELPATSLGVDHTTDGALLQINAPGPFPARPFIKEKNYQIGDFVIATGHPGGPVVARPSPLRLGRILEAGTESGFSDPITSTATVISGDSGGPLYNLKGEVIGINSNISMPWSMNKHVPLPSIVEKWDALLNGKSFGSAQSMTNRSENLFDEPYAELRERFEQALEEHPNDPLATQLLKRPRLLDPHHMQEFLDRVAPDKKAEKAPRFGFSLDLQKSQATISQILPKSPAAKAGLKKGDIIVSANDKPIENVVDFALMLRYRSPLTIVTQDGKTVKLKPDAVPRRRHFPQPVAGLISMIVTDPSGPPPASIRDSTEEFLSSLNRLKQNFQKSIVQIKRNQKTVVHATVISPNGEMVTKASEIKNRTNLKAYFNGEFYPLRFLGEDRTHDIALLSISAPGLTPVTWSLTEPDPAKLVFTPLPGKLSFGIITQPARPAPKKGFESNVSSEEPSSFLGVRFSPDTTAAIVSGVDLNSPADRIGIFEGDEITKFGDRVIDSAQELQEALAKHSPGEKVTLVLTRGDEQKTLRPILDLRPSQAADSYDRSAARKNDALHSLSARGGKLSRRNSNFPRCLYHDQTLRPEDCGTPLLDRKGNVLGLNIARSLRHRTLAIPGKSVQEVISRLRR